MNGQRTFPRGDRNADYSHVLEHNPDGYFRRRLVLDGPVVLSSTPPKGVQVPNIVSSTSMDRS
jgi:hypothetical protein